MSKHSRQTLTFLAIPALAVGTIAAVAQTAAPDASPLAAPAAQEEVVRGGKDLVHDAQFRGRGRGGMNRMLMGAFEDADADDNGALTQSEIDDFLAAQLTEADTNDDGAVSLEEFQTVYAQRTRPRMVDAFQRLDEDGDGAVTGAELSDRFGTIVSRMDRNGDDALSLEDRRGRGERGRGRHRGERRGDR